MPVFVKELDYRNVRGYKYQTLESHSIGTEVKPNKPVFSANRWVCLGSEGTLTIKKGYCWDGASGPTFDTASTMRASLFHDALFQLIREGLLSGAYAYPLANTLLYDVLVEDGCWRLRAKIWLTVVNLYAGHLLASYD